MAAPRYLKRLAGRAVEVVATTLGGAGNEEKIIATNASGKLDQSLMPAGIGADTVTANASEALSAGDLIQLYDNAGTPAFRKADSSNARDATHFTPTAVASGAACIGYRSGDVAVTGRTVGAQYLSTAGGTSTTEPSTAGHISQRVGFCTSATVLEIDFEPPITIA